MFTKQLETVNEQKMVGTYTLDANNNITFTSGATTYSGIYKVLGDTKIMCMGPDGTSKTVFSNKSLTSANNNGVAGSSYTVGENLYITFKDNLNCETNDSIYLSGKYYMYDNIIICKFNQSYILLKHTPNPGGKISTLYFL